ncbi:MFS transporter [Candidatus Desulfosporosinus nitrosoreducens]|uniref:MFS transporter n=1 Tax=Candidatus Desulfosporosinus nitrosoreducens TaxID=3401928 RepID=UPI00280C1418|nr:MFS transporter [Desulfosporosinus sp. PR]
MGSGLQVMDSRTKSVEEPKKRNQTLMCLMIFLISMGEGLTAPAIPLLGKSWGAGYLELGLLMTGYGLAYIVMTLIAGHRSDHFGRKIMLLISLSLSLAASIGYFLAGSMFILAVSRITEGASRGMLWPVAEAAIADNSDPGNAGRAMGTFTAAYGIGVTCGTLAGGTNIFKAGFTVFTCYPVLGLTALLLIAVGFTNKQVKNHEGSYQLEKTIRRRTLKLLWPIGIIGFAYGGFLYSIWGLFSALANEFGVQADGIGILFGLFWGLRTIAFLVCRVLLDNRGSKLTLLSGLLFCTGGAGILLLAKTFPLLLLAVFLSGAGTGLLFPTVLVLVNERTSEENRGFGMGFLELLIGLGMVGQTAVAGFLGQSVGPGWIYSLIFLFNGIALAVGLRMNFKPLLPG